MHIQPMDFRMEAELVAPVVYGTMPHQTTGYGVRLSQDVALELERFLEYFNAVAQPRKTPYYRIDAYFTEHHLHVLEVNASFVDGWGTALNLARASGIRVDPARLMFPHRFATRDPVYLPELELLVGELALLGVDGEIVKHSHRGTEPIYVYGRVGLHDGEHIFPHDGTRLDNKMHLGLLSAMWRGQHVKIPHHHLHRFGSWQEIPDGVVLKFCEKGGPEQQRARTSVIFGKPQSKAPFLKQCYEREVLLAQEYVEPTVHASNNCQLVIFAIGAQVVTGYVQYSPRRIIDDNATHGPLQIS